MSKGNVQFTPVKDFFSEEFQSQYLNGLSYTAKPEDKKLLALLPDWVEAGKVRLGLPTGAAEAKVAGKGDVSWPLSSGGESTRMTIGAGDIVTLKL